MSSVSSSSASPGPVRFLFTKSDPGSPVNGEAKNARESVGGSLKTKCHTSVHKLFEDPISQRHPLLQKLCMRALASEARPEVEYEFSSDEPIDDICLINVSKNEKPPQNYTSLERTVGGQSGYVLKGSGSKYMICFKRVSQEMDSLATPDAQNQSPSVSQSKSRASAAHSVSSSRDKPLLIPEGSLSSLGTQDRLPITDIVIARKDEIPFGYTPITRTATGNVIYSKFYICTRTSGHSPIKQISVICPARDKVPSGYQLLKFNLNDGSSSNFSSAASDSDEVCLCVSRDHSFYIRGMTLTPSIAPMLEEEATTPSLTRSDSVISLETDCKFIPPFLIACHLYEPILGTVAMISLQELVADGFFDRFSPEIASSYISSMIICVCDALATSNEPNFQVEIINLLKVLLKKYLHILPAELVTDITVGAFSILSRTARVHFLEVFAELCIKGPPFLPTEETEAADTLPPTDSSSSPLKFPHSFGDNSFFDKKDPSTWLPEPFFRGIMKDLVDNVANARIFEPLLQRFQQYSVFDPRFSTLVRDMCCVLFSDAPQRRLACFFIALCKIGMEDESDTTRLKYKYGLSRKHSALFVIHRTLEQMHLAASGASALAPVAPASSAAKNDLARSSLSVLEGDLNASRLALSPSGDLRTFHQTMSMKTREKVLLQDVANSFAAEHRNDPDDDDDGGYHHKSVDLTRFHTAFLFASKSRNSSPLPSHNRAVSTSPVPPFLSAIPQARSAVSVLSQSSSMSSMDHDSGDNEVPMSPLSPALPDLPSPPVSPPLSPSANPSPPPVSENQRIFTYASPVDNTSYEPITMNRQFAFLLRRVLCSNLCRILMPSHLPSPTTPPYLTLSPEMQSQVRPAPVSHRTFTAALMFFTCLWKHYAPFFKNELGVMLDGILLEFASHEMTSVERKQQIVSAVKEIFSTPQDLVNLYYNYDNMMSWTIFERLLSVLAKIIEESPVSELLAPIGGVNPSNSSPNIPSTINEEEESRGRTNTVEFDSAIAAIDRDDNGGAADEKEVKAGSSNNEAPTASKSRLNLNDSSTRSLQLNSSTTGSLDALNNDEAPPPPTSPSSPTLNRSTTSLTDSALSKLSPTGLLQLTCIEFVVSILSSCDTWYEAKALISRQRKAEETEYYRKLAEAESDDEEIESKRSESPEVENISNDEFTKMVRGAQINDRNSDVVSRKGTVINRFMKQKADRKAVDTAIRIARTKDSLAKAIQHLEGVGYLQHNPSEIAEFIHREISKFELETVGEYIGGKTAKDPFEEQIRVEFIRRLNLQNVPLHEALRRFLTDSGFRLPGEGQKIERILASFGVVYTRENPKVFDDPDAAFVMSTAILMLNTALHNPNLKERMSESQFIAMVSSISGTRMETKDYKAIYSDIRENGYQIDMAATAHLKANKRGGRFPSRADEKHVMLDPEQLNAQKCQGFLRKAEFNLKRQDLKTPLFLEATSLDNVTSLFELSWFQFMALLSQVLERSRDTRIVTLCVDGFKHLLRLCTQIGLPQEKNAVGLSLARYVYMYQSKLSIRPKSLLEINTDLVKGLHQNLPWLERLNGTPTSAEVSGQLDEYEIIDESTATVTEIIDDIKKVYIRDTNFKVLRDIQARIVGDVNIIRPGRYFIREGTIGKVCQNGERRQYRLFLFSDALLYASAKGNSYKAHRMIMLAFAHLPEKSVSQHQRFSFRVISPQKTITFFADSLKSKDHWIDAIRRQINRQQAKRMEIISVVRELAINTQHGVTQNMVARFENTTAFLNKSPKEMRDGNFVSEAVKGFCPLCLKAFRMLNRPHQCKLCLEEVCSSCMTHKVSLTPTTKKIVCDGCYGLRPEFLDKFHLGRDKFKDKLLAPKSP